MEVLAEVLAKVSRSQRISDERTGLHTIASLEKCTYIVTFLNQNLFFLIRLNCLVVVTLLCHGRHGGSMVGGMVAQW